MLWRRLVRTRVQLLSKDDALLEIAGHRMCPIYRPIAENVHAQIQFSSECGNFKLEMTSIKLLVLCIATICCRYKMIMKSFKFHLWILIWLNSTNFNFVQNAFQQITFWTNWNYSRNWFSIDLYYWYGHRLSWWRSDPLPPENWKTNFRLCPLFSRHILNQESEIPAFLKIFVKYFNLLGFFWIWNRGSYTLKAIKQSTKLMTMKVSWHLVVTPFKIPSNDHPAPKIACTWHAHTFRVTLPKSYSRLYRSSIVARYLSE